MATPPPPKRIRPQYSTQGQAEVGKIVSDAQSIPFPWTEAVPEKIRNWYEAFAKSHNTAPEYAFAGALVTTAVVMGPKSFVKVRETYKEPTNVFAICVGFPGSGKSQAYRMTVREPIESLASPLSTILVDDYTKKGLFRHLQNHSGRALLAHEEMGAFFDLVQKRQLEGNAERQLYYRLYDGGQWVTSTGLKHSDGRQEVDHNCVCINGYLQPQPFLERIYPLLMESDDGFVDRLLVCFPKTHILMEEEVDSWCTKLHTFPLTSLIEPFKLIAKWHCENDDKHMYSYGEEGMQVYRSFANEMAQIMNEQWETGVMNKGNVSKDKRTMIRLSGILHVLYKAMDICLTTHTLTSDSGDEAGVGESPFSGHSNSPPGPSLQSPGDTISEEEARMAVALTEYFQEQRRLYEQVHMHKRGSHQQQDEAHTRALAAHVLMTKGAFCTPRSGVRGLTTRSKPTTLQVMDEMKHLDEEGIGKFQALSDKEKAFYKPIPIEANKEQLLPYVNLDEYADNFKKTIDTKHITAAQYNRLLLNSPDKNTLTSEYGLKTV